MNIHFGFSKKMAAIQFLGILFLVGATTSFSYAQESGSSSARHMELKSQQQALDDQIAQAEQHLSLGEGNNYPHSENMRPGGFSGVELPNALTSQETSSPDSDPSISVLDEVVVEDFYVDPFDEGSKDSEIQDPWESFNSSVFTFNQKADQYFLKPLAMGYHWVLPDVVEEALGNAFHNVRVVPRFVNNVLQGKGEGAGVEVGRFLINSTAGVGGLVDVADLGFDLNAVDDEDTGQTLGVYGVPQGPYLVLPFLPPLTARDGVGFIGDIALDPFSYLLPFSAQIGRTAGETVSIRSQNLARFQGVEDSTLDLYGAVRDAYGQSRAKAIQE